MNKKGDARQNTLKIGFICCLVSLIFILSLSNLISNGNCTPDEDPDESCHEKGPYEISSDTDDKIKVEKGEEFIIDIRGEGPDVIVRFHPDSLDNDEFGVEPSDEDIEDNSKYDEDNDNDKISVNYTLTAPNKEGTYKILFYVRSPPGNPPGQPYIDYIEFEIIVGRPSEVLTIQEFLFYSLLDHYNIYLGTLAIICLSIGTLLVEKDSRKYLKTHSYLSMAALIFTTISVIFIFQESVSTFMSWFWSDTVDYLHFIHFGLGIVGYGACIVGFLAGLSGIYHKKSGYVALACWGFNFVFGLIYWGISLGV